MFLSLQPLVSPPPRLHQVHTVYETLLDWDTFSVRVNESALSRIPEILSGIPEDRVVSMRRNVLKVWQRFAYTHGRLARAMFLEVRFVFE